MEIRETEARSILVRSRLPDADYVANPYTGCEFGCVYCYASFMGGLGDDAAREWGSYVTVKTNAVELFRKEIARLNRREPGARIFISSVTDPYQGVESKYRLTRGILEAAADSGYAGLVSVQTKSSLVLRDIDVLKRVRNAEVGMTVTTTDDELGRLLEVRATRTSERLAALRRLADEGIRTYAFVGPLLPRFRLEPGLLDRLFSGISGAGVREIYVEHMNLRPYIRERLFRLLANRQDLVGEFSDALDPEHRKELNRIVERLAKKHGLRIALGGAMHHREWMEKSGKGAVQEPADGNDGGTWQQRPL
jgi:DNA repair photolyase